MRAAATHGSEKQMHLAKVHLFAKILSATAVETLEIDCCQAKKLQHTAVLVSDIVGRNLARTVIGHD